MLLRGPSGAGKSDLALRLAVAGWRLVADDRVIVWVSAGSLFGRAPAALSGLVELRGQGMGRLDPLGFCGVHHVVDLGEPAERQPGDEVAEVAGVRLPRHTLRPFDASASARLALLLSSGV